MFLVIPEIELEGGKCKFCIQGELNTAEIYKEFSQQPHKLAQLWRRENAKSIYIKDSDSFNEIYINQNELIEIANSVDIPVQLHYKFRSKDECDYYLVNNIYRLVLDFNQNNSFELSQYILDKFYHSKISLYYQIISDELLELNQDLLKFISIGIKRLIIDDINIGSYKNILNTISNFAMNNEVKITIYHSVDKSEDLWKLQEYRARNIDSVIINKPLYENAFPCQRIWRLIEAELEN